jgi:hypothetical protein
MFEDSNKTLGTRTRLIPIPRVKSGLAATSLFFWVLDAISNPAQYFDRVNRRLRQQLIHEARNE